MPLFSARNRIIKKAVKNTVSAFEGSQPEIFNSLFYGEVDLNPKNLAVWYIFETDKDLRTAKENGLCTEIIKKTVDGLLSLGYPPEVFEAGRTCVSFTSQEDIDKKADGDFHLYFQ